MGETDKYTNNDSNAISAVLEGCAGCHGNIEAAVLIVGGNGEDGEGFTDMVLFYAERSIDICQVRGGKQVFLGRKNTVHQGTMT